MIPETANKMVVVTPPAAIIDNASAATTVVDTQGFAHCTFYVMLGATDIALSALKVQESDAKSGANLDGNAADIVGSRFGTDANTGGSASTLPSATADNLIFAIEIDLRKSRKRYLDLVATLGDGTAGGFIAAWAVLSRADNTPTTAAERGCSQILRVA